MVISAVVRVEEKGLLRVRRWWLLVSEKWRGLSAGRAEGKQVTLLYFLSSIYLSAHTFVVTYEFRNNLPKTERYN